MKISSCAVSVLLLLYPLVASGSDGPGAEDRRFVNLGIKNSYMEGMSEAILKAFDREAWSYCALNGVHKVGEAYVINGTVTLDGVKEPATESDFERLKKVFGPFVKSQLNVVKQKGGETISISDTLLAPVYAEGRAKNRVPTMQYRIAGEKDDLFWMTITFSNRKDDHLVVDFTIVAVP